MCGRIEEQRLAGGFETLYKAIKQAGMTREPEGERGAEERTKRRTKRDEESRIMKTLLCVCVCVRESRKGGKSRRRREKKENRGCDEGG